MRIADKMLRLHEGLAEAEVAHAFGGALALAWCTERARGTVDVDLNLFMEPAEADRALSALPKPVVVRAADRQAINRDGQVRLRWSDTPIDLFFSTTPFHDDVATRLRWEDFAGTSLPFLDCTDLAVFKAFFNRTRDWADLEDMAAAGTLDVHRVLGILVDYLGGDDERVARLRSLTAP